MKWGQNRFYGITYAYTFAYRQKLTASQCILIFSQRFINEAMILNDPFKLNERVLPGWERLQELILFYVCVCVCVCVCAPSLALLRENTRIVILKKSGLSHLMKWTFKSISRRNVQQFTNELFRAFCVYSY